MSFMIATDTAANLPDDWLAAHRVVVTPLTYLVDGVEHTCSSLDAFPCHRHYAALRAGASVSTAQAAPQAFCESWGPVLAAGRDVLYIGLSSGISGTLASAQMAADLLAEQYPDRTVLTVDSRAASLGEGLVVRQAVALRDAGYTLRQAAAALPPYRDRLVQLFTVDDLQFLQRGGRISALTQTMGTLLNIKPLLKGNHHGRIVACGKVRGRQKALEALAQRYADAVVNPCRQVVGIAHADCPADAARLAELLRAHNAPLDIWTVPFEPVTGSHAGPGALALFFESQTPSLLEKEA